MEFEVQGHWLSRADFMDGKVDEIAFTFAFMMNVSCQDKEALLELLRETAKEVMEIATRPELP